MKAIEQYFSVVLFIVLYKVVLTFESVDGILNFDHSSKRFLAVLSCGAIYYAVQSCFNFLVFWMESVSVTIQIKATEQ